ncbi:MAG TPA: hypothetical protein PKH91_02850 [Flavobacterium sp.]|jgi:hypothetical protein|nr:hypothetical protein [Flavobacterium sp.]
MKKAFLIVLFFINSNLSYSQTISCNELLSFIKENGYLKSTISSYTLNSSWLYKVTAYEYDYKTYVVAEIKRNEYSYSTDTYIFCGIPNNNWNNFKNSYYNSNDTYGERFHKYIIDYKCNCN